MKNFWLCLLLLLGCSAAHGLNCSIAGGSSGSTIQAALTAAGTNSCTGTASSSTVLLNAGSYSISSVLTAACGTTITGPAVFPNTASITISNPASTIFYLPSGCSSFTLEYLAGYGGGLLYVAYGNSSGINILHNTTGSLPSSTTGAYDDSGSVYFAGDVSTSLSNVTIKYNSFGDANSCTTVFNQGTDYGGYCAGVLFFQGALSNVVVEYNKFYHLEEGVHFNSIPFAKGAPEPYCDGCDVNYNYFLNIHRIAIEFQVGATGANHIDNNILQDPSYSSYGTLNLSAAGGQYGTVFGTAGYSPGYTANNNVNISSLTNNINSGPPYGIEFWGNGAQANNNLIQGNYGNGVTWGLGASPWEINNNQICGPDMASASTYISNERGQTNTPSQSGNVTSSSCSAITSVAPSISPASGSFTSSVTVTLTDTGLTSGAGPQGNTSIYFTTDGSTPVPGSGTTQLYTAPLTITSTTTVNAVGLYGSGGTNPQTWPTTYPSGYGFVPSSMVSATYTAGGAGSLGNTGDNTAGYTNQNYFNDLYAITGINAAGYTVNTGTVCIAPGTVTNGANTDVGISTAPTATTEGTNALCHATYTNTSSTSPGCVTMVLNGCGLLTPNKAYWLWTITNDPISGSPLYFSNCGGGTCTGSAPTSPGIGTYAGFYLLGTYGSYAGMSSTFDGQNTYQPSVSVGVTPAVEYGVTTDNVNLATSPNYFNDVYAVTGASSGGYTVNAGTVCMAPGTVTNGAKTDIGINTAPTATTEGATAICHATYTNTSSTSPGCVTVPLTGCGTLSPNTPYWLWTITNDPITGSPLYSSNCGSTCSGTAPTSAGTGTYGGFYLHGTYGTYTGMSSAFTGGPGSYQPSVSLSVTPH
jgi:Chitobiase/beta-hexosaminidase C-terminal domain